MDTVDQQFFEQKKGPFEMNNSVCTWENEAEAAGEIELTDAQLAVVYGAGQPGKENEEENENEQENEKQHIRFYFDLFLDKAQNKQEQKQEKEDNDNDNDN